MIALEEGHNISLAFRGSVQHLVGRDVLPEAYAGSGQSTQLSRPERHLWAVGVTSPSRICPRGTNDELLMSVAGPVRLPYVLPRLKMAAMRYFITDSSTSNRKRDFQGYAEWEIQPMIESGNSIGTSNGACENKESPLK